MVLPSVPLEVVCGNGFRLTDRAKLAGVGPFQESRNLYTNHRGITQSA